MPVSQGSSVADEIRCIAVTEVTYYRWRQEYCGLKSDQVKRMKRLGRDEIRHRGLPAKHPGLAFRDQRLVVTDIGPTATIPPVTTGQ